MGIRQEVKAGRMTVKAALADLIKRMGGQPISYFNSVKTVQWLDRRRKAEHEAKAKRAKPAQTGKQQT